MNLRNTLRVCSLILLSAWLAACGGSGGSSNDGGDDGGDDDGALSLRDLDGSWISNCIVDGPESAISQITFNNGTASSTLTSYSSSTTCTGPNTATLFSLIIVLGDAVTVDGSIAGITVATEVDITDTTTPMLPEFDYNLFAIKGDKLYIGELDGPNDGSTPALRPTQLDDELSYTRN